MDRQGTLEKKNKIKPLETGKYNNIDTLYINKNYYCCELGLEHGPPSLVKDNWIATWLRSRGSE